MTLVFWEHKLYDLCDPWNIWRFVHNDIQIFEPKIFEYSSQKYSNIRFLSTVILRIYSYSVKNMIPNKFLLVFVLKRSFRIYSYSYSVLKTIFATLCCTNATFITLQYCYTVHCYITMILHCYNAKLLQSYIATWIDRYIATLLHRYIPTLLHCYIATLLHCYIGILLHCSYYYIATLLHC